MMYIKRIRQSLSDFKDVVHYYLTHKDTMDPHDADKMLDYILGASDVSENTDVPYIALMKHYMKILDKDIYSWASERNKKENE